MAMILQLHGLVLDHKEQKTNGDFAGFPTTHSVGGGEWSLEVPFLGGIKEFVGSNGTRGYEADDLWGKFNEWCAQPLGKPVNYWKAPDGTVQTKSAFYRDAKCGNLHGLVISF